MPARVPRLEDPERQSKPERPWMSHVRTQVSEGCRASHSGPSGRGGWNG